MWVGVRKDESIARSKITSQWECEFGDQQGDPETAEGIWLYRPILNWGVDEVFAIMKKHGIEPNPLYKQGMGRVGCMPCVMCNKRELKEIAVRFPEVADRLEDWEEKVSRVALRGKATFFNTGLTCGIKNSDEVDVKKHGIRAALDWAKTSRGGRQFNFFDELEQESRGLTCSSIYGLCE